MENIKRSIIRGKEGTRKIRRVTHKIIDRKFDIVENLIDRKLEIIDGFTRRKAQSKESVRKAARELFNQFGIDKVSIIDIARKAGVSQATIYNNFGSKESLERDYILTTVERFISKVREILTSDKPFKKKLKVFIQFIEDAMTQYPDVEERAEFPTNVLNDPKIKKMQDEIAEKVGSLILELINEGKEQGEVKSNISGDALAIFYKSFIGIISDPEIHLRLRREPRLVHDLLLLGMYGMFGQQD
jgi:AcrR family transcriptional regulator